MSVSGSVPGKILFVYGFHFRSRSLNRFRALVGGVKSDLLGRTSGPQQSQTVNIQHTTFINPVVSGEPQGQMRTHSVDYQLEPKGFPLRNQTDRRRKHYYTLSLFKSRLKTSL